MCLLATIPLVAARYPFAGPLSQNGPTVAIESNAIVASNVRHGGIVHFASVSLSSRDGMLIIDKPAASIADTDNDGLVRFETPVQTRSLWLVVDGSTGGYTVASPRGFLLRLIDFQGNVVHPGVNNALRRILAERNHVDIVLVRPGDGMWTANVKDGNDDDGELNGSLMADLSAFRPLASTTPVPDRIMPGDVIFIVDRNSFEFLVTKHSQGN